MPALRQRARGAVSRHLRKAERRLQAAIVAWGATRGDARPDRLDEARRLLELHGREIVRLAPAEPSPVLSFQILDLQDMELADASEALARLRGHRIFAPRLYRTVRAAWMSADMWAAVAAGCSEDLRAAVEAFRFQAGSFAVLFDAGVCAAGQLILPIGDA